MNEKLKVGILGGTGMVGQRFLCLLKDHPWFRVTAIMASKNSAGSKYIDCVKNRWNMEEDIPDFAKDIVVNSVEDIEEIKDKVDFVFSAVDMPKDEIIRIEEAYAKAEIPVVSNNSANRFTEDVPMVIPEINSNHFEIIDKQKERLGTKKGFIVAKPNCSIQSYVPALNAWQKFEPYECVVTTYQAISGAGKTFETWPEMQGNIIPFISGEEYKSEKEPLKIFGHIDGNKILSDDSIKISCQCIRVPVLNGHTAACFVKFRKKATKEELIQALKDYRGLPQEISLPSAPETFIKYFEEENRPQVILDVMRDKGMGISIGRIREDEIYDFKFVGLSHNTIRGAAGGAVLCAEALNALGYFK